MYTHTYTHTAPHQTHMNIYLVSSFSSSSPLLSTTESSDTNEIFSFCIEPNIRYHITNNTLIKSIRHVQYLHVYKSKAPVHNITLELWASWEESIFFTSQILFLMSNFSTVRLVGRWLTLTMQRWNRNRVYFSVIPTFTMLCLCQHHIANQP